MLMRPPEVAPPDIHGQNGRSPTPHTLHPTPYTPRPISHTPHPEPHTIHPSPYLTIRKETRDMLMRPPEVAVI